MIRLNWQLQFGLILLAVAVVIYALQIAIFQDTRSTYFYLFQDLAFLPVQVLLVTLVLNAVLARREKEALLKKMNMVIGAFFTEMGVPLLRSVPHLDLHRAALAPALRITNSWTAADFRQAQDAVRAHPFALHATPEALTLLTTFLQEKQSFLLGLLENPNLLEHETFTELLWALSHLAEELRAREDLHALPASDLEHLAGDITRAYALLLGVWLAYCRHLQQDYPISSPSSCAPTPSMTEHSPSSASLVRAQSSNLIPPTLSPQRTKRSDLGG